MTLPSHFLEGYQFEFDQPKYRIYILLMIPFLFTKGIFLKIGTPYQTYRKGNYIHLV